MMTLHTLTHIVLLAIPLAGLLLALGAVIAGHVPIPTTPFAPLCDDAPPVQPVTQERTYDEENT